MRTVRDLRRPQLAYGLAWIDFRATDFIPRGSSLQSALVARIVLTGFMGAGKSTLGPLLAESLGWRFIDLDDELVRSLGASIADLFARIGESAFRLLEADALRGLLAENNLVLALGGGALDSEPSRTLLFPSDTTYVVFLEAPFAISIARCAQQTGAALRPLLAEPEQLEQRFTRRLEHYRLAHFSLDTTAAEPKELVQRLLSALPPLAGKALDPDLS